jgi:hypothetical protein
VATGIAWTGVSTPQAVQALIYNPTIWNNLADSITRSRLGYSTLATDRDRRLAGKSRMNFNSIFFYTVSCALALMVLVLMIGVITVRALRTS